MQLLAGAAVVSPVAICTALAICDGLRLIPLPYTARVAIQAGIGGKGVENAASVCIGRLPGHSVHRFAVRAIRRVGETGRRSRQMLLARNAGGCGESYGAVQNHDGQHEHADDRLHVSLLHVFASFLYKSVEMKQSIWYNEFVLVNRYLAG